MLAVLGDEQNPVDVVAQQVGLDPAHVLVRLDHGDDELQAGAVELLADAADDRAEEGVAEHPGVRPVSYTHLTLPTKRIG